MQQSKLETALGTIAAWNLRVCAAFQVTRALPLSQAWGQGLDVNAWWLGPHLGP